MKRLRAWFGDAMELRLVFCNEAEWAALPAA